MLLALTDNDMDHHHHTAWRMTKKGNGKGKILKLVEYCTLVGVTTTIVSSVVSH